MYCKVTGGKKIMKYYFAAHEACRIHGRDEKLILNF
jgi:hypothetical protein